MAEEPRSQGVYERFVKRPLDCFLALFALIVLSPILIVVAVLVRVNLGSPILFTQIRPGKIDPKTGRERLFKLYKFRTMTDARDASGQLLPDDVRLTKFGAFLRSSSLDELPELINIFKGEMSVIGPRPQLVRDMTFMTPEQRRRHEVRPGLSGLAQISGRNAARWEEKLAADLKYVEKIRFCEDVRIVLVTFLKVFKREGIAEEGFATAQDFGDYLLAEGKIDAAQYQAGQDEAKRLLDEAKA